MRCPLVVVFLLLAANLAGQGIRIAGSASATPGPVAPAAERGGGSGAQPAASGQGIVVPAAYRTQMGDSNNLFPHGQPGLHYQQVFLGSEIGGPVLIDSMVHRQSNQPAPVQGGIATEIIALSLTSVTPVTMSSVFSSNLTMGPPTIVAQGTFNLPALTGANNNPGLFAAAKFPFQRLFAWPGPSANLLLDVQNIGSQPISHFVDAASRNLNANTSRLYAPSLTQPTGQLERGFGLICCFGTPLPAGFDEFDSSADVTMNFGAGNVPLNLRGPVRVVRGPGQMLPNGHIQVDTDMVSSCMDQMHPTLGPVQLRIGTDLGLPPTKGRVVSNQPGVPFPATGTFGVNFSMHGRDYDLCPDQAPFGVTNPTVTVLPPNSDYAPTVTITVTFKDACTGQLVTTQMTVHTRHRPLGQVTAPPTTLIEHCSTLTIANIATAAGFARLSLRVAPGEPNAGTLIASSGNVPVVANQTPAATAAALGNALAADLSTTRPCCPCKVTVSGPTITVCCRSLRRFTCYLEGTSINSPPFGIDLERNSASNLGQTYRKNGLRTWMPWGTGNHKGKVAFTGTGCSFGTEASLETLMFGDPQIGNTVHLGASMSAQNRNLPHALLLDLSSIPNGIPLPPPHCGTLFLAGSPAFLVLPLPPPIGSASVVPFRLPNNVALRNLVVFWQALAIRLSPLSIGLSDAMAWTIG